MSKMNKSDEKNENGKQGLAAFVKEKRQSKNLSLEKLSDLTKIQLYHLKAIEDGRFNALPPLVYRSGIFKRLAKFLETDENEILKLYGKENQDKIDSSYVNSVTLPKKYFYFILTPKKLILFFGGLLLVLLSLYLWYQFNFLVGPPTLVIEPRGDMVTKDEILSVKGRTDAGVDLTINGENVYVSSNGSFEKSVQLAAGLNVIEVKAVNNFGKITKTVRKIFREQ